MTESDVQLCSLMPSWVTATANARVSVPSSRWVRERVEKARSSAADHATSSAGCSTDDLISVLSLQSCDLARAAGPSLAVLEEAKNALASMPAISPDEFGEATELRCRFAFIVWRHCRALGMARQSQEWIRRFDELALRWSVSQECVSYFLGARSWDRSARLKSAYLLDPESLLSLCALAKSRRNSVPAKLAIELPPLYEWVHEMYWPSSFLDEREYFLAQMESSIGVCRRWLGDSEDALIWFERADRRYAKLTDGEAGKAEVQFLRLTAWYSMARHREVIEQLPSVQESLVRLEMTPAFLKSELLRSSTLKQLGRVEESIEPLERILAEPLLKADRGLWALAVECLADCYSLLGRFEAAAECLSAAIDALRSQEEPIALAFLKLVMGENLRFRGEMDQAVEAYRGAKEDYKHLGLYTWVAYASLLVAEALLILGEDKDAEAEILTALPIIEERKLVREGLAAATILRESMRRRKTDRNALRELREHLRNRTS